MAVSWVLRTSDTIPSAFRGFSEFILGTAGDRCHHSPSSTDKAAWAFEKPHGWEVAELGFDSRPLGSTARAPASAVSWLFKLCFFFFFFKKQHHSPNLQRILTMCLWNRYYLHSMIILSTIAQPTRGNAWTSPQSHPSASLSSPHCHHWDHDQTTGQYLKAPSSRPPKSGLFLRTRVPLQTQS